MVPITAADYAQKWETNPASYSVLKYFGKGTRNANLVTDLILAFKENQAAAVQQCVEIMAAESATIGLAGRGSIVLAAPRSVGMQVNEPSEAVCARLAADHGLKHIRHGLQRVETVPKSRRDRVPLERHFATIQYAGDAKLASQTVIVVDDLRTRGTTMMACEQRLLAAGATAVLGLYVGRTQWW